MAAVTLASLFTIETAVSIAAKGLQVATSLGLPVTSWAAGDPTRSLYHYLAEVLSTREEIASSYAKSGFLDDAEDDWLTILAKQVYNVDRGEGTAAAGNLTLANASGSLYYEFDAGDLTFENSSTGKTYRSTSAITLGPNTSGTVAWEADEVGSDSSAGVDEIDTLVTSFNGLSVTAAEAGLGTDPQSDEALREACRASLGALSPNGPADAYKYVALSSALTGTSEVTRCEVDGDTDTGDVTVYIAGSTGDVTAPAVTAVEDAIAQWATPLCHTPTVVNATEVPVTFTLTVYIKSTVGEVEATIQTAIRDAIADMVAALPIGGNDGYLHTWLIEATIRDTYPAYLYNLTLAAPAANVALTASQVATVNGTPGVTVVFL